MATLTDARFETLRAKGYAGSVSDMTRAWLLDQGAADAQMNDMWRDFFALQGVNRAALNDMAFAYLSRLSYLGALPDMWHQFWLADAPTPVNLYPNPEFAGGPPPTGHTFLFETTDFNMLDQGDGSFHYESNPSGASGRHVMGLDLTTLALSAGVNYRVQYTVTKVNAGGYSAALATSGLSGVTVLSTSTGVQGGQTTIVQITFSVTAGYTGVVRVGCGTTANNTAHLIYKQPRLFEV